MLVESDCTTSSQFSTMSPQTIFILGATGYLGSEFLILLARDYPDYPINALVRNATPEKIAQLHELHPHVTVVEGTLEDADIIIAEVQKADIVINTASSDHWPSVKGTFRSDSLGRMLTFCLAATLDGLEKSSAARPGNPPLYIHVSGCGILSDNARGELKDPVKVWSDIGLDLEECAVASPFLMASLFELISCTFNTKAAIQSIHIWSLTNRYANHLFNLMRISALAYSLNCDGIAIGHGFCAKIVAAGTRKENPVRTIIIYPGQIYGVGRGA